MEFKSYPVLINECYGGFTISKDLLKLAGKSEEDFCDDRYDITYAKLIHKNPELSSCKYSKLGLYKIMYPSKLDKKIVEKCIKINEYDGNESIDIYTGHIFENMIINDQFEDLNSAKQTLTYLKQIKISYYNEFEEIV